MKTRKFQDMTENPENNVRPEDIPDEIREKVVERMDEFFQLRKTHEPARYTMDDEKTINHIRGQYKGEQARAFIDSRLDAGVDNHVRLKGTSETFYMTGSEASGQFLTEEIPGETSEVRREELQLPDNNDAKDVYLVHLNHAHIVVESKVAPQPSFAEKAGYAAREGGHQIFVPPKYGNLTPQVSVVEQVEGDRPHKFQMESQSSLYIDKRQKDSKTSNEKDGESTEDDSKS